MAPSLLSHLSCCIDWHQLSNPIELHELKLQEFPKHLPFPPPTDAQCILSQPPSALSLCPRLGRSIIVSSLDICNNLLPRLPALIMSPFDAHLDQSDDSQAQI